jgi:multidrug efflux pump subunit AcrB
VRSGGHTFHLGDIAKIERSYVDPPEPKMVYNGQPAIGLALSMEKGGNILDLGKSLEQAVAQIKQELPLGLELHTVTNQPTVVKEAINEFVKTLAEAIAIVLLVSFASLGLRSGFIVALCIPLVIAGVFIIMDMLGIALHKVSLGALIIALGLLVDDAIIAIEMMIVKLEQGWSRFDAACHAYTATAFPMLTGTLITCAGFIPVGFSKGSASEFVGSIFSVITTALLISWVVSVMAAPLFGYRLLKVTPADHAAEQDVYNKSFYRLFKRLLSWCLSRRRQVLSVTVLCFIGSLLLMGLLKQEFFPAATRPELIVELQLPEGASPQAIEQEAAKFASRFADDDRIASYTYYLGGGAPRFVLTADPPVENSNFAQFVFVAKDLPSRLELQKKVQSLIATEFTSVRGHTKIIQSGTTDPYPVMLRINGPNHDKVRNIAGKAMDILATDPNLTDISLDWNEKSKVLRLDIDQAKARALGIDNQVLSTSLQSLLSGAEVGEFREKDKTVGIVFRVDPESRQDLSRLKDLNIHIGGGRFVPLDQIAQIRYEAEEGMIWRRDLKPTITVQAGTAEGVLGDDAAIGAYERLQELRTSLPSGYSIKIGGSAETSENAMRWLLQPVPAMVVIIITLLMFQLHNIPKMLMTLLTAPLGMVGVTPALLLTGRPMGFVVQLGILALAGIIIRNSVILIDQIDRHIDAGEPLWDAIINATVSRFRPIMLTAAAAILGMLPLVSSIFWGPMAVAIAGGLFVATILTLIVLPVMYAVWYKATPSYENRPDITPSIGRP